jgi:hypothetical protein
LLVGGKSITYIKLFWIAKSVTVFVELDSKSTWYKHRLPAAENSRINSKSDTVKLGAWPTSIFVFVALAMLQDNFAVMFPQYFG